METAATAVLGTVAELLPYVPYSRIVPGGAPDPLREEEEEKVPALLRDCSLER